MKFYTSSKTPRPVRLSKETRAWAWESMHGKYGDEAMECLRVELPQTKETEGLSDRRLFSLFLREIAEKAPIRICPYENISGAATLGEAVFHMVPALCGDRCVASVSHVTVGYERTLKEGMNSYEAQIKTELANTEDDDEKDYLQSLLDAIEAMRIWHKRYLSATKEEKPEIYERLLQVPFSPARDFREAVQSLWFQFAFLRLCGNWPGIGRIDVLLGDYLRRDIKNKKITIPEAREFLASLFIKGCEWIRSDTPPASGDAQHYQNIILGGTDKEGRDVTNEVTYLVLDIIEETGISDFPVTVRLHENTPEKLLKKCAKVVRLGGGVVAFYNEKTVFEAMERAGYPHSEVYKFANDGCWETQIPGETDFGYMPFDALQILNRAIGLDGETAPEFSSSEEVYEAFRRELRLEMERSADWHIGHDFVLPDGTYGRCDKSLLTTPLIDIFEKGCIEKKRSYFNLGPRYTVRSPHIGGAPDAANSLHAIDVLVFDKKLVSFPELWQILKNNWEGAEELRLYAKNKITYYGNDDDRADSYLVRILGDFARFVKEAKAEKYPDHPLKFVPGVSTFGRQIGWAPWRSATAFGAKKGDILAPNDSPTPGTDVAGVTALIKSYCKADLAEMTTGAALDVSVFPETFAGEDGLSALCGVLRGFVRLGGYFMQIDCVDKDSLLEAQKNPEAYKTLSVRVSGWNARFVTLDKNWQNMIIERDCAK